MATREAVSTFRRVYADPRVAPGTAHAALRGQFSRLWDYYSSAVYEDLNRYQAYKSTYGLYRQTRAIYNPVRRLVDFYAGTIYPGVLSPNGLNLPDGVSLAVPLADDTPEPLRGAIGQWWQWTNWQAGKSVMVRYGAIAGSVLVEIVDDLERGKVTAAIRWPDIVDPSFLQLDPSGNVKAYALEYRVANDGDPYTYRKEVTPEVFRTFRDGKPFDYSGEAGVGTEWENPYGFVPAVWVKHGDIGGDYGAPAIDGTLGKIDELNSLASHIHDQAHKKISAPALLAGVKSLTNLANQPNRGATGGAEFETDRGQSADRQEMLLIGADMGAKVESLAGTLELSDAVPYLEKLLGEIEQDHPELTLYRELRAMSQVTGPGAQRMLGDAAARVLEAQANYDLQSVKLFSMAVAIGGYRLASGDWGQTSTLSRQQQKFAGFDLSSYARGDLDFSIMPRPLVVPTRAEQWAEEASRAAAVKAWTDAGLPFDMAMAMVEGKPLDGEEMTGLMQQRLDAIKREQALATEDTTPAVAQ